MGGRAEQQQWWEPCADNTEKTPSPLRRTFAPDLRAGPSHLCGAIPRRRPRNVTSRRSRGTRHWPGRGTTVPWRATVGLWPWTAAYRFRGACRVSGGRRAALLDTTSAGDGAAAARGGVVLADGGPFRAAS